MKKLNVLLGLMLIASFSFAQIATVTQSNLPGASAVVATVTQTGMNVATINQTNVDGENGPNTIMANVEQVGVGIANEANVNQTVSEEADNGIELVTNAYQEGEGNIVNQVQMADGHRDDFVSRNFVSTQLGTGNIADQTSIDSDQGVVVFVIDQNGDGNTASQLTQNEGGWAVGTISQSGTSNDASQVFESIYADGDIIQNGTSNMASQHFHNNTNDNYANINQDGIANEASQVFTGGNTAVSTLTATQFGNYNYSEQMVISGNNNMGVVFQTGDEGEAYQTFVGESNYGSVDQSGSFNVATQTMYGDMDNAMINQVGGETNHATQTFSATSVGNNAAIYQEYVYNNANATQYVEGASNDLYIQQTGGSWFNDATQNVLGETSTDNLLTIIQGHGDDNNALQTVVGSNNEMYIEQHGIWYGTGENAIQTITGDDNYTEIIQVLDGDYAEQTITGDYNTAMIHQEGGASATMTIVGENNVAALSQGGFGSVAVINQTGCLNVVQGLGGTGTFAESNNGSTLYIDQMGDSHVANVYQNGGFADINQSGVGNIANVNQY